MKHARAALCLAAAGLFSACAYVPPKEGLSRRTSPNYTATGEVEDARAFLYGNITLLEFDTAPAFLVVRDEKGESVSYERVGRYYRLPRVLDTFTVWVNGRSVTFSALMTTRVFSARTTKTPTQALEVSSSPEAIKITAAEATTIRLGDKDVVALLKLSEAQCAEVRRLLDQASQNPKNTGQELFDVNQRLNEIEARTVTAAAAIVQVGFPTASTAFKPSVEVAEVLIAAGKAADVVTVRGHTDAKVAGRLDAKIALGRALAARRYLVDHGVSADKIKVFSQADGGFAAPNNTKEGRALNRRVEFEFVNARITELKSHTTELVSSSAQ